MREHCTSNVPDPEEEADVVKMKYVDSESIQKVGNVWLFEEGSLSEVDDLYFPKDLKTKI